MNKEISFTVFCSCVPQGVSFGVRGWFWGCFLEFSSPLLLTRSSSLSMSALPGPQTPDGSPPAASRPHIFFRNLSDALLFDTLRVLIVTHFSTHSHLVRGFSHFPFLQVILQNLSYLFAFVQQSTPAFSDLIYHPIVLYQLVLQIVQQVPGISLRHYPREFSSPCFLLEKSFLFCRFSFLTLRSRRPSRIDAGDSGYRSPLRLRYLG